MWVLNLLLVGGFSRRAEATDLSELARLAAPSVCTIHAQDRSGDIRLGTAFAFGINGEMVTNEHVIGNATFVQCASDDAEVVQVQVLRTYPEQDLAFLFHPNRPPPLRLAPGLPSVGSEVAAIGNPKGVGLSISGGNVSAIRGNDEVHLIQHTAAISPGNSGGPLLAMDGSVLGVNTLQLDPSEAQNLNFAIPASAVLHFAEEVFIQVAPSDAAATTTSRQETERSLTLPPQREMSGLAGVTIGSRLSGYAGLTWNNNGTLSMPGVLAGWPGEILITPCGVAVHDVGFLITFVSNPAAVGVSPQFTYSNQPIVTMASFVDQIAAALREDGWQSVALEEEPPNPSATMSGAVATFQRQGSIRSLGGKCGIVNDAELCFVHITQHNPATCSEGL